MEDSECFMGETEGFDIPLFGYGRNIEWQRLKVFQNIHSVQNCSNCSKYQKKGRIVLRGRQWIYLDMPLFVCKGEREYKIVNESNLNVEVLLNALWQEMFLFPTITIFSLRKETLLFSAFITLFWKLLFPRRILPLPLEWALYWATYYFLLFKLKILYSIYRLQNI